VVSRPSGGEGVHEPGPGDIGEERVGADVGLEGSLDEADHPELSAPGVGRARIVEQDEAPGPDVGVLVVACRRDIR